MVPEAWRLEHLPLRRESLKAARPQPQPPLSVEGRNRTSNFAFTSYRVTTKRLFLALGLFSYL